MKKSLKNNIEMPHRIETSTELFLGVITFVSTLITGDMIVDFIIGVVTYSSARLFYHYYNLKIKGLIDKIKQKLKRSEHSD